MGGFDECACACACALAWRGPVPPGLKDIGIRGGTFKFLFGVEVAVVGCGAVGVGRGGSDEIGVGPVACVGREDGPGSVDDANVAWWDCGRPLEGSWFWVLGVLGDDLRTAACAAASRGVDGTPTTCELGGSTSEGAR
jgi:hypothetical protein